MHLFWSLQLLLFCMDNVGRLAKSDYVFLWFFYNIVIFNHFLHYFIVSLHLGFSFFHIKSFLVPYVRLLFYWIDEMCSFIIVNTNSILLTSSVYALCLLLINICYHFNINLLFLMNSSWIFFEIIYVKFLFFVVGLFPFKVELLPSNAYNLQT